VSTEVLLFVVCLLLLAHRAVVFATVQLSCFFSVYFLSQVSNVSTADEGNNLSDHLPVVLRLHLANPPVCNYSKGNKPSTKSFEKSHIVL